MKKIKATVVMGGPSREYEVSLNSGKAMLSALDPAKYEAQRVVIDKRGQWLFGEEKAPTSLMRALDRLEETSMVLLAVHGTFGEDGTLQALLENRKIAFTGSDSRASLLAIDKDISNVLFRMGGLKVPSWHIFADDSEETIHRILEHFSFPLVIKPPRQGSSYGISIVKNEAELKPALTEALKHDFRAMVQVYIKGREVSCGVLEIKPGSAKALPPTELIPNNSEFFDYEAKYTEGGAEEITPPKNMPEAIIKSVQDYAIRAHKLLGCRTYSRSDMFVNAEGVHMIETNTLPGMTSTSILPQQAKAAGISLPELVDILIQRSL